MPRDHTPPLWLALFVWGLGALFYLMGFFQRVAPAVMTAELMREFEIGAAALGNLSAFYFYSYVAMQIPTGIMVDRWGPRRLLTAGCLVAGAGTALFALAPAMVWAGLGRLLIGGSVAVAFVGLLQVANNWFPARYFAMVGGMALFFGIVGAVFAGPPLRLLLDHYNWRSVIMLTALITLVICLAVWFFVRDYPHEKGYADPAGSPMGGRSEPQRRGALAGAVEVFKYRNTVLLFLIPGGVVGCVLTFAGLWGVPFLASHHGLTTAQASALTSALLVAWALGGPVFGWASDRLGSRKPLYIGGCAVALLAWLPVVFLPSLPLAGIVAALLLIGFSSGCMIVSFAYAKESVPADLSGTVAGVINMGVMLGPTLLQPAVGWVLDCKWGGETLAGVRLYGLDAYRTGFCLMLGWALLALVLLFFTRETHCRQSA